MIILSVVWQEEKVSSCYFFLSFLPFSVYGRHKICTGFSLSWTWKCFSFSFIFIYKLWSEIFAEKEFKNGKKNGNLMIVTIETHDLMKIFLFFLLNSPWWNVMASNKAIALNNIIPLLAIIFNFMIFLFFFLYFLKNF